MTKYRNFLAEVELIQLRDGRDGLRVVGPGHRGDDNALHIGLVVPHVTWTSAEEWWRAFGGEHLPELELIRAWKDVCPVSTKR